MTLERLSEWVRENYPPDRYFTADDLISDVEQRFNADGHDMNDNIRQLLIDQFTQEFSPEYRRMRERMEERKQIAEFIGNGELMQSLSDEILADMQNPSSEIMGIDMTEFSTQKEEVYPPEVVRFAQSQNFFGRLTSGFRRIFRRR